MSDDDKNTSPVADERHDQLLTRAQAAAVANVSSSTIRRAEGKELPVVIGVDGVHRFRLADVESFGSRRPPRTTKRPSSKPKLSQGELAARIFRHFRRNDADLVTLVRRYQITPAEVRALYREFQTSLPQGEVNRHREAAAKAREAATKRELAFERASARATATTIRSLERLTRYK
ncbi:MAG: hypothetical protein ACHREM_15815 [Polyangiales bacterium]